MLKKYSLNEITAAFGKKYPDSIPEVAKLCIREFDNVIIDSKIILLDRSITWEKIQQGLRDAVLKPRRALRIKGGRKGPRL